MATRNTPTPRRCAIENTVIGTVASASFVPGLNTLARSAISVGFPCIVVQPFDWFEQLRAPPFEALLVPSPPLLPRTVWCTDPTLRHQVNLLKQSRADERMRT